MTALIIRGTVVNHDHSRRADVLVDGETARWNQFLGGALGLAGSTWGSPMVLRSLCLLAVCFGLPSEADAGEQSGLFHRASCTVVRYYVAKYTAPAAEAWARSHGATDAEIEAARHCLQVMPVQAATVLSAEAPH